MKGSLKQGERGEWRYERDKAMDGGGMLVCECKLWKVS